MGTLGTRHLMDIDFELGAIDTVGATPYGHRVIGNLGGGRFRGDRLSGRVLPSGGDWGLFMPDGTLAVDGRACFETDDGVLVYAVYTGRWAIAPEQLQRIGVPGAAASVPPSDYYLRIQFLFEVAREEERYAWLNRVIAVGSGRKTETGIAYEVFEIT